MINLTKLNIFLSSFNFLLVIIGYQLVTTLLLPISSDVEGISRSITVPFRLFCLFITLIVIGLNFKKKSGSNIYLNSFFIFWFLLAIRFAYDLYIRSDIYLKDTFQLQMYVYLISIPLIYSIYKSYNLIDFDIVLKWFLILGFFTLLLTVIFNPTILFLDNEMSERINGNVALNSISFGQLGCSLAIVSLYTFINFKSKLLTKLGLLVIFLFSFILLVKSGSRSPFIVFLFVLFFWLFSSSKYSISKFLLLIVFPILVFILINPILEFLSFISPVMGERMQRTIYEGDTSGREPLHQYAIDKFLESPVIGKYFGIISSDGSFGYSHNFFLDVLMSLGVIGFFFVIIFIVKSIKKSYYIVNHKVLTSGWLCLLFIQQLIFLQSSSTIYYNQLINCLIIILLMFKTKTNEKSSINY